MEDKKPEGYFEPGSISEASVMERLLPCPFCGGMPKFEFQAEGPPEHGPSAYWPHQIVHACRVLGSQILVRAGTGRAASPDAVIDMWNSRYQPEGANK